MTHTLSRAFAFVVTLLIGGGFLSEARAADQVVVVELFTSQGCYSCPPADAYLDELVQMPGVLPLAFHVDYWDYLGWKDTFGSPENTERQRAYAGHTDRQWVRQRIGGIFTPEAVVQGVDSLVGSDRKTLQARIAAHLANEPAAALELTRNGDVVTVRVTPEHQSPEAQVMIATFLPQQEVSIARGENRGKTLVYFQVVTGLSNAGTWNGTDTQEFSVSNVPEGAAAVFLQAGPTGPIIAAARMQ